MAGNENLGNEQRTKEGRGSSFLHKGTKVPSSSRKPRSQQPEAEKETVRRREKGRNNKKEWDIYSVNRRTDRWTDNDAHRSMDKSVYCVNTRGGADPDQPVQHNAPARRETGRRATATFHRRLAGSTGTSSFSPPAPFSIKPFPCFSTVVCFDRFYRLIGFSEIQRRFTENAEVKDRFSRRVRLPSRFPFLSPNVFLLLNRVNDLICGRTGEVTIVNCCRMGTSRRFFGTGFKSSLVFLGLFCTVGRGFFANGFVRWNSLGRKFRLAIATRLQARKPARERNRDIGERKVSWKLREISFRLTLRSLRNEQACLHCSKSTINFLARIGRIKFGKIGRWFR